MLDSLDDLGLERVAAAVDRAVAGDERAAADDRSHGYPEFRGLPELKAALAARYADVYGVEVDAQREIAVVPGTKTALVELCLVLAERGSTIALPDPGYPDYFSGVALADAALASFAPTAPELPPADLAYLNYPSNPCAVAAPAGELRVRVRRRGHS